MTVTLGRCTGLDDPWAGTLSMKGDLLSFDSYVIGVAQAGTVVDDMNAKVQQLRGLMDNVDEDVFPATFSEQPEFDGFYTDFDVTVNDAPAMLASGACPFSVSMRRVAGAAAAQFENTAVMVAQSNGMGLPTVTTDSRVGVPYTSLIETSGVTRLGTATPVDSFANGATLTTDDGTVRVAAFSLAAPNTFRWQWAITPASADIASARFEQSYGGTYYPLHGQQVLPTATAWRVSNGLVRVSLSATKIQVSHYDGSAWDTVKEWAIGASVVSGSALLMSAVTSVRVLTNTPQVVVVKCGLALDSVGSTFSIVITLRRGCRFASFDFRGSRVDQIPTWYITNAEAGTALTGGFRATATDAAGNRYVCASAQAQNNTLASGTLKLLTSDTSGVGFQFCLGSEVAADGTGQTLINQYINAISESQRVVSR